MTDPYPHQPEHEQFHTAPASPQPAPLAQLTPDEMFPVLWHFIHRITQANEQYFQVLLSRLLSLQVLVHSDDVESRVVQRRLNGIRTVFRELQQLGLWGLTDKQRQAFALLEAEIVSAYPEQLPTAKSSYRKALTVAGGGALVAVGAGVVLPAMAVGGLGLLGFSSVGPVAGSAAAAIQSGFYGGAIASGSAFALAQAAAMGGIAVGSTAEIVAAAFAVTAGVGFLRNAANEESDETAGEDIASH
ncbi:hypothetical protein FRB95_001617 [Tulasnella sp. JGI-2019a]|nr:hypothetical protein FRB93_010581 [Tulasnella sp. JGI-2019a]KAG9032296.1 hypothetical protein FRB95_001617 [Tulasnella sp. JGI-2019a]